MDKIKLEPTAALVMLWALKLYNEGAESSENLAILPPEVKFEDHLKFKMHYDTSHGLLVFKGVMSEHEKDNLLRLSQDVTYKKAIETLFQRSQTILKFINRLDLSSGKDLYDKCNAVCPWYEEVILNRKYFIKHLIEQHINATKSEYQLVLLAAGKSPLSLEILTRNFSKVHRIFEVDLSGMEEKEKLYQKVSPEFAEKLKCITADITSHEIIGILNKPENDFHPGVTSITLMEGISYYLSTQEIKDIITSFRSKEKHNIFVIEHLVPYQCVKQERRDIPKGVFNTIQEYTGLNEIRCYTKDELQRFFRDSGGDLIANYTMKDMEFARTSANAYFREPGDGWIECSVGKI